MAVLTKPAAPKSVEVEACWESSSILVRWAAPARTAVLRGYRVHVEYYSATSMMARPMHTSEHEVACEDSALEIRHPEGVVNWDGLSACTVKVAVTSVSSDDNEGGCATRTTTWDSQAREAINLEAQKNRLRKACSEFKAQRGQSGMRIVVIGPQHHGKSSLVNHFKRCFIGEVDIPDEMKTAPAGASEITQETLTLKGLMLDGFDFSFTDTPAFAAMTHDNVLALDCLLANGVQDGVRRRNFADTPLCGVLQSPFDAAIIVVSLLHWVSMRNELQEYLNALAQRFNNASQGRFVFPYVVAATKRDEFLLQCQDANPRMALSRALNEIKEAANTEQVFAVTNLKERSLWSEEVTEETFRLLASVVAFAKNRESSASEGFYIMVVTALVVLVVCLLISACT